MTSLKQQERTGQLPVYPAAEILLEIMPKIRKIWKHYVDRGSMQSQEIDDRIQETALLLLQRMGPVCSRQRANVRLIAWCVQDVWRSVLPEDPDESGSTVVRTVQSGSIEQVDRLRPAEYLRCRSTIGDLNQDLRNAADRRDRRRAALVKRASQGIDRDPISIRDDARDLRRSNNVKHVRGRVRLISTAAGVSAGLPGDLRMTSAWRRVGTGSGSATRPRTNSLGPGSTDLRILPGVEVFDVSLFAPRDREERAAYVNWLRVFAR